MKLKSLLIGSIAATGMTAGTAQAADLGVVLSALNVCDSLGITGLTIASDSNCLRISGGVSYEATLFGGDELLADVNADFGWSSNVEAWLKFEGIAESSFGPAMAVIKLTAEEEETHALTTDGDVIHIADSYVISTDPYADANVTLDEAYVAIGDTTIFTFGKTGSVAKLDEDGPLNYLGLYHSNDVDAGVSTDVIDEFNTGGHVIQVASTFGDGFAFAAGLEGLENTSGPAFVGVISYDGNGVVAHATALADLMGNFGVHAGIEATIDMVKLVGAIAVDSEGDLNALGSAEFTFDMFKLAVSGEYDSDDGFGFGGGVSADVTDAVTVKAGGWWFEGDMWEVGAGVDFTVTETLTAGTAFTIDNTDLVTWEGSLTWKPEANTSVTASAEVDTSSAWELGVSAEKTFK